MRHLLCAVALSVLTNAGFLSDSAAAEKKRPPNFVIFFTDDQGYNDVGCFGSPLIETPNFDRMASEGLKLTSFYAQPVCGVSRAALMTGCYPIRVGEPGNLKNLHTILHPEERTIAEVLRDAGYATGMVGKWHLGARENGTWNPELMPNAQGFDFWFGAPSHNGTTRTVPAKRAHTQLMRNGKMVDPSVDQEEMGMLTQRYTEEALAFLRDQRDRPFFLYLAHTMPHVPINSSPDFLGKSKRGLYGDVIGELDWSMGRVLEELKTLGLDEQTMVIFTSDNGPWIERHLEGKGGTDSHCGSADPLRGAKMMTWEGGIRVPCIVRWPGTIEAGRVSDEIVSSLDLFPTLANLAGASVAEERAIDGVDQTEFLLGDGEKSARDHFLYYAGTHLHAVRSENWKLVRKRQAKPGHLGWWARMIDRVPETALYDLDADPSETSNVAAQHPEIVVQLETLIANAREELGDWDQIGKGARFFDPEPRLTAKARWEAQTAAEKENTPKRNVVLRYDQFAPLGDLRFDFESGEMDGWTIVSGDFAQPISSAPSLPRWKDAPFHRRGKFHLSTVALKDDSGTSDKQKGVIESPRFVLEGDKVAFLLSGGGKGARVALCDAESGEELMATSGPASAQMKRFILDVGKLRGKTLVLRLVDDAESGWGHLCFDDFSAAGKLLPTP